MYSVYQIKLGKKAYYGCTSNYSKRITNHLYNFANQKASGKLQKEVNKLKKGVLPVFTQLHSGLSKTEANALELKYITEQVPNLNTILYSVTKSDTTYKDDDLSGYYPLLEANENTPLYVISKQMSLPYSLLQCAKSRLMSSYNVNNSANNFHSEAIVEGLDVVYSSSHKPATK